MTSNALIVYVPTFELVPFVPVSTSHITFAISMLLTAALMYVANSHVAHKKNRMLFVWWINTMLAICIIACLYDLLFSNTRVLQAAHPAPSPYNVTQLCYKTGSAYLVYPPPTAMRPLFKPHPPTHFSHTFINASTTFLLAAHNH